MASVTAALLIATSLAPAASAASAKTTPTRIFPGKLPSVRTVDERFMSFQIGFSHLTGGETWKSYDALPQGAAEKGGFAAIREERKPTDLANPRLRALTRALGPLYIRYSGTTANSVYFHDSDAPLPDKPPPGFTVALTREAWKGAVDFARAVDAKILTSFANSDGVRDRAHAWTPRMAAPWLAYTRSIGGEIVAAELFNEPNAPEPPRIPKGHSVEEFGRDFAAFRLFMKQAALAVKVAGPGNAMMGIPIASIDAVSPEQYFAANPAPKFDIVSYHFYPVLAERCAPPESPAGITLDKALDENFLARPDKQIARYKALRDKHAPGAPIWITETGGAACGGLRWQPTFLDAFRFLDTHARSAKQGIDAMFTHALVSGSNGVIDEKTFQPNASYWGAVLWRRLMGSKVLDAGAIQPGMHLYAHCQRGRPGGVTLLAINMRKTRATLGVTGPAEVYALTAPELQSKTVLLNGGALALRSDDTLPAMPPARIARAPVALAPTSIAFIALPRANNRNCRE